MGKFIFKSKAVFLLKYLVIFRYAVALRRQSDLFWGFFFIKSVDCFTNHKTIRMKKTEAFLRSCVRRTRSMGTLFLQISGILDRV